MSGPVTPAARPARSFEEMLDQGVVVFNSAFEVEAYNEKLPEFKLVYTLERGMQELHRKFLSHDFGASDFESDQFVRLRTLRNRMHLLAAR